MTTWSYRQKFKSGNCGLDTIRSDSTGTTYLMIQAQPHSKRAILKFSLALAEASVKFTFQKYTTMTVFDIPVEK
ncbi:hypothetical protein ACU8KH_02550 [Lachancea thermotolerans]